jgi:hypothetical protein
MDDKGNTMQNPHARERRGIGQGMIADMFQTDADEWIEQTPLVQALRASLQQDESLGQIEEIS